MNVQEKPALLGASIPANHFLAVSKPGGHSFSVQANLELSFVPSVDGHGLTIVRRRNAFVAERWAQEGKQWLPRKDKTLLVKAL
jgi:hypothetical protein